MINPLSKQWFTSNAFSHYSHSLKFIILGCYCRVFSAEFLWTLALLLSVYVVMKPNLVLCHSVLWRPLKNFGIKFQGQIELKKYYRDKRGNKVRQQFAGLRCISPGCSLVCHLNNPRGSALGSAHRQGSTSLQGWRGSKGKRCYS